MPNITTASVRIMRSYDYGHFEVALGTSEPVTAAEVDEMRQEAARMVDKAVDDYKAARAAAPQIHRPSAGGSAPNATGETFIDYNDV